MVYLKCENGNYYDNIVTLKPGLCKTNIKPAKKGKWYYEIQQIKGPSNNFLGAWYYKNSSYIGVYPCVPERSYPLFYLYTPYNDFLYYLQDTEHKSEIEMDINNLNIQDRIGVGIDIDSRINYFRSNNHIRINRFNIEISNPEFQPYIFESTLSNNNNNNEDTVHVYFELSDFHYDLPFGYKPWGSKVETIFLDYHHKFNKISIYLFTFLI